MGKLLTVVIMLLTLNVSLGEEPIHASDSLSTPTPSRTLLTLDIDGDGQVKPLTDGLLVLRYLFNFRNEILINKATDGACIRCTAEQIEAYIQAEIDNQMLDIDGDGSIRPLTDGLLLLRYFFGFRDATLIDKAVQQGGTRTEADDIEVYIETLIAGINGNAFAPVLNAVGDQTLMADSVLNLALLATDADGDTLVFTAAELPEFAILTDNDDSTATLKLEPSQSHIGNFTVTIIVSDGEKTDSESFKITVETENGGQLVAENTTVSLNGEAISGGENITSYTWEQTSGTAVVLSNATEAVPTFTAPAVTGEEILTFQLTFTNTSGSQTTATVTVEVGNDLDEDSIPDRIDPDRDGDGVNNEDDFFPDDKDASTVPTVKILSPDTLITVGSSPITITGSIDDATARLTINGVDVSHSNGQFTADVALEEGLNSIVARGIDTQNHEGLATITVSLDKTPPHVTVQSHEDNQTVYTDKISVGGLVNDIVRGAVTETDAVVRVNGQLATVTNRSYLAEDIQLVEGENTLEVIASDAVGNVGNTTIKVVYEVQTNKIISLVSGQSQSTVINSALSETLKVKLTSDGTPVVDKTVIFRVIEGDGLLQPGTESQANGAIVKTNANGEAIVSFKVGSRAGNGNHRVRARAVGFEGEIIFHASATYGAGNKAGVIAGNNQRGSVRQPLPQPFVLAVTDAGTNLIPDADIEFKVTVGSGKFQNDQTTYLTKTDKDGRASAHFTLGAEEGLDQQRVTATLVGTNAIAGFTASAFMPGDPGQTSVVGVVLDNQDNPLPAVTIRVDDTTRQAVTDDQGQFTITEVPVGPVHLLVEGSTTTREGEWPTLSYNIVTVPGVENPLASPIYLVELDMKTAITVGTEDTEFILPEMPGFKLKVKAGSVTFPDGSKTGKISVTPVNANKIPMPPPNGMQPQFIVTIQPHGAKFDPPAELTLPNVDGHLPGAEVEMYSYDHDLEEFVTIGLGTVSKDGSIITSNAGVGVIKAGWHCGSQPGGSGCCEGGGDGPPDCGECADPKASGDCPVSYSCKPKPPTTPLQNQISGNCQTETCGGGEPNDGDKPPSECGTCIDGKPDIDKNKALDKQEPDDCKTLMCDGDHDPNDETAAVQAKGGDFECKVCQDKDIENGPDGGSCGDGSATQACYTCKNGKCGNNCDASSVTHTFESTAPDFVLKAITGLQDVVNRSPIFVSKLSTAIDVKLTSGELCCESCETPEPKGYKEFSGFAGVKGTLQVTIPGLGIAYEMPKKVIAGSFVFKGEVFATLLGAEIEVNSGASVAFKTTECSEENCGSFTLGTNIRGSFGPQVKGSASFDSCLDTSCDESVVLIGAQISGGGVIDVGGSFQSHASSGSHCGSTCFGGNINPTLAKLYFSVGVEIVFKKYTFSADKSIELHPGGPVGSSCG